MAPNKSVSSDGTDKDQSDDVMDMDPKVTVSGLSEKGTVEEQVDSLLNVPNTDVYGDVDEEGNPVEKDEADKGEINVSEPTVDPEGKPRVEVGPSALTANPNAQNVVMTTEGENGVENSPADYDNLNQVPTAYSNPPAVSPDDENAVKADAKE